MHHDIEDNDDLPVGRVHSRREVLALFGGVAGAALVATSMVTRAATGGGITPAPASLVAQTSSLCVVTPEETEGPYFVEESLDRSDIRTDPSDGTTRSGVPLQLTFNIATVGTAACAPLAGATVDVWHCDALGVYSDVRMERTLGKKFLRGTQTTDANGMVQFTTIYPGWYPGRAVHIHFKVRTDPQANTGSQLTSQLYFDDALSDTVFTQAPYASKGRRDTRNSRDGIYADGGDQLLLTLTGDTSGYAAVFNIGLKSA